MRSALSLGCIVYFSVCCICLSGRGTFPDSAPPRGKCPREVHWEMLGCHMSRPCQELKNGNSLKV